MVEHLQYLGLVGSHNDLAIVPIHRLSRVSIPAQIRRMADIAHTIGLWKASALFLNNRKASLSDEAPLTTEETLLLPTYSRMVWSWSAVGGSSVTLSSNSARWGVVWAEWSLAWSSVACSVALALACFSTVATRTEAGELALWKRVMMSLDLRCQGIW